MTATDTPVLSPEGLLGRAGRTGSPPERFTSTNPADFAVPTGREEQWKFTPLRPLRPLFQPADHPGSVQIAASLPDGVELAQIDRDHPLVGAAGAAGDRISALARAGAPTVHLLTIPAEYSGTDPIVLRPAVEPGLSYGHLVIEAAPFASAVVVLDYAGAANLADTVELIVRDGAKLTLVTVQDFASDAIHVSSHDARLGRDATLRHVVVSESGKLLRIAPTVHYTAPGGTAELYGLSYIGENQHSEARLYVDHSVPQCSSDVIYKSVVEGDKAHAVWVGDVRIRPAATATSTYELNRNLLLTDGARADSVPNLEIETGEIAGAGHASATGRFDEQQLFYLQSRGIPETEARRLVIRGFFGDILARIPVSDLRERLAAVIDARLDAS